MTMFPSDPDGGAIRAAFLADEATTLRALASRVGSEAVPKEAVGAQATAWIEGVRARQSGSAGIEQFLTEYGLATHEGVLLMCIAEALLRIPDAATADRADPRQALARRLGEAPRRSVGCSSMRRRGR